MPATAQSLRLTDAYRAKLSALTKAAQRDAKAAWKGMSWNDLSGSYGPIANRVYISIFRAQTEAVRLTAGYLGAYLSSELGTRVAPPIVHTERYVGKSYGNLPLRQSLDSPRVSLLAANKRGDADPMGQGLRALLVNVDLDVKHAAREALREAMEADDRIVGWRRAVKGTCDACMGAAEASVAPAGTPLEIHPNCECVSEATVNKNGVPLQVSARAQQIAGDGVKAIQQHRWPTSDPIPVEPNPNPKVLHGAVFKHGRGGPTEIRIPNVADPATSDVLAHEAGHYLDYLMMGGNRPVVEAVGTKIKTFRFLTDKPTPAMKSFIKAARGSRAFQEGEWSAASRTPREMWARAYQQWAMGHAHRLPPGIPERLYDPYQWDAEDFKPIGEAIERVLKEQGLRD